MMNFKNEEAVSPVIGVILMVAITVILAAIIATFALNLGGSLPSEKDVYVTVTQGVGGDDGETPILRVTIQGGKDVSALQKLDYLVDGTYKDEIRFDGAPPFEVGMSGVINLEDGRTTIRGVFADNSVKILAEKDYVGAASGE